MDVGQDLFVYWPIRKIVLSVAALFLVQSMQNEFLKITCKVWFQLAIGSSRLKKVDIIRKTR
jgi:hypothetical protein